MRSVRVFFKKYGNMKFISHLDLNRFMIKMVRISGIPVWYSEGFNPHPYITFALPLSLGFESCYEVMDIRLDDDSYPNAMVYNSLKPLMPKGIEIISCSNPVMKAGDITYAEFLVEFDEKIPEKEFINFISADRIEAEKRSKKGGFKTVDLKEYIYSYSLNEQSLKLVLAAGGSNNLNPKLLLDAFCSVSVCKLPTYSVTRTMIFDKDMNVFE